MLFLCPIVSLTLLFKGPIKYNYSLMKKELSEGLIIVIIGLALVFFESIVKLLGIIIIIYGVVEIVRERKESKKEQKGISSETPAAKPEEPKESQGR